MTDKELTKFERFFLGYCVGVLDGIWAARKIETKTIVEYLRLRGHYLDPKAKVEK